MVAGKGGPQCNTCRTQSPGKALACVHKKPPRRCLLCHERFGLLRWGYRCRRCKETVCRNCSAAIMGFLQCRSATLLTVHSAHWSGLATSGKSGFGPPCGAGGGVGL